MLYFFHSQYLLLSADEVSREAFQKPGGFLIPLLLDNWEKQKITVLHSLSIYFHQNTSSSVITTNHCLAVESLASVVHTER